MKYRFGKVDLILILITFISILIIISVGFSIGKSTVVKDWDVKKVNYFINKLTELAGGAIVSVVFYYLIVVLPELQRCKSVRSRIKKINENFQVNGNRVVTNLLMELQINKNYIQVVINDYIEILKELDVVIVKDKEKFKKILTYWHFYTLVIEKYLQKLLNYYKDHLNLETLVEIEELLESLHLTNIRDLPYQVNSYDPEKSKLENISYEFATFHEKLKKLSSII